MLSDVTIIAPIQNNQLLFPKKTLMANTYLRICSTSLIMKGMQIKTTVRHLLTPVKMAITKRQETISVDINTI